MSICSDSGISFDFLDKMHYNSIFDSLEIKKSLYLSYLLGLQLQRFS